MLSLDWNNFSQTTAKTTLHNLGLKDISNLAFSEILAKMKLGSEREVQENFPEQSIDRNRPNNIKKTVDNLVAAGIVKDIIGKCKFHYGNNIFFLTLVNPEIKKYMAKYAEVIKHLQEKHAGFNPIIWLEDRLSVIKNGWDIEKINASVSIYQDYFTQAIPKSMILLGSKVSSGIPLDFTNMHLAKLTGNDLLNLLPYYYRNPRSTSVLDVIHFAWMCYLIKKFPGIHLAGANTNRQYQLYHKFSNGNVTGLLIARS